MAANTNIEWCDHTFNPWIGCTKVSTSKTGGGGCDNCYAEQSTPARVLRARGVETWGPGSPRHRTRTWSGPVNWNSAHAAFFAQHGRRQRVFCASLADVFDNAVDPAWRADLFRLIEQTPNLDWLLLTKRIGNAAAMMFLARGGHLPLLRNLWVGATVVNQAEADRDILKLLAVPARVRFLSIEPMLGPIDLLSQGDVLCRCDGCLNMARRYPETLGLQRIDWVICGGESGPNARPMHPDWARSLRDQCAASGIPFLFKQWGEWIPADQAYAASHAYGRAPIREFLQLEGHRMHRVGKKAAGRLLDGVEHNGFPS